MNEEKRQTLFVIFSRPQLHGEPGTHYISKDGLRTDLRSKAAQFYSFQEAKDFAEHRNITFTALTYIGREDFTDLELQG
ncbi:MAG: hypothetical protein ABI980_10795 [Nitrospirota bacterium]